MTTSIEQRPFVMPTFPAWYLFVLLLMVALGSEYWDKDPMPLAAGLALPWPTFVLALFVLPLIVDARDWRWTRLRRVPAVTGPLLVFWVCCGLSVFGLAFGPGRPDAVQFLKTFIHLTAYVLFVYALVKWMTWPRLTVLIRAYYWLGIAAAAFALVQYAHGAFGWLPSLTQLRLQSFDYSVGMGLSVGFRATSVFGEASWASRYYVHWIALALAFWWQTGHRRHLAALLLFLLAFYVANSLLGYVILATFVLAVLLAQLWRQNMFSLSRLQKGALFAAVYFLAVLWLAGVTPPIPDLMERSIARVELIRAGAGAVGNRLDSIWAGLEVWRLAPIFGVGLGNIGEHIVPFYRDAGYARRSRFASDSLYIQLLAETGLVGLAGFLFFWGRLVRFAVPAGYLSRASPEAFQAYTWLRFLQLDLVAQAVGMLNYADYLNPHLWTVVGIVLASKALVRRELACESQLVRQPARSVLRPAQSLA